MPYRGDVLPFLAKGFKSKQAIKNLMASENEFVRWRLATNPYLSSGEIDQLFEIGSSNTKIVLAARYDLTDAQLMKIVSCRSDEMLIAIMAKSSEWKATHKLSNEVALAITSQEGFDPTSELAFELADQIQDDFPDKDLLRSQPLYINGAQDPARFFEFRSLMRKVNDILQFADFSQYADIVESGSIKGAGRLEHGPYEDLKFLDLSSAALVEMDNEAIEAAGQQGFGTHLASVVCKAIEEAAGARIGEEFFSILIPLLEDWTDALTLGDALNTTLTLMGSPSRTS